MGGWGGGDDDGLMYDESGPWEVDDDDDDWESEEEGEDDDDVEDEPVDLTSGLWFEALAPATRWKPVRGRAAYTSHLTLTQSVSSFGTHSTQRT